MLKIVIVIVIVFCSSYFNYKIIMKNNDEMK